MRNKKGISPLIATVLLIGFTIVLAALVMRWGGTLFKTTTSTTGCESQGRLQCTSTNFAFTLGTITVSGGARNAAFPANNEGSVSITDLIVQREDNTGAKTVYTHATPIALAPGATVNVAADFGGVLAGGCTDLKRIYTTPVITYTPTDGSTPCQITCSEQQVSVDRASITACS